MKEMDRIKDAKWVQEFLLLRDQVGPIIHKVSQAEDSSSEEKFVAFSEALWKLPVILKHMKQTPKPKHKKLRLYKKLEEAALDAYIKSCEWGIKWLKDPNPVRYSAMVSQASMATLYWEMAPKEAQEAAEYYSSP